MAAGVRSAPGSPTSRAARTIVGRSARRGAPALLPGGRTIEEADDVEAVWGPIMNREPGRDTHAILRACADREIDVLFLRRGRSAARLPRRRARAPALQNVPNKVVQSLELGRSSRSPTRSCRPRPFIEKDGHVTTWEGRGQRLRPIRGAQGISLRRLGDLREPRARVRRRPRVRDARRAARGDGPACSRRGRGHAGRSAPPRPAAPPTDSACSPTRCSSTRVGSPSAPTSSRRRSQEPRSWRSIPRTPTAAGDRRRWPGASCARTAGEAELPARVTEHVARGRRLRALQPARASRPTPSCRVAWRAARGHARRRVEAVSERRGRTRATPREVPPDGLGRLVGPGGARGAWSSSRC